MNEMETVEDPPYDLHHEAIHYKRTEVTLTK